MAVPTVLYDCNNWMPAQKDLSRIQLSEVKFLRRKQDRIRNESTRPQQLNICSLKLDKIGEYGIIVTPGGENDGRQVAQAREIFRADGEETSWKIAEKMTYRLLSIYY